MKETGVDIDRYLAHSAKVRTEDLDWEEARRVGLTPSEVFTLTYFSDIEGQTIFYLRDLLNTRLALDPEVTSFLTMWNYEEFFHARVLAQLLEVCGHPLSRQRSSEIRKKALPSEKILASAANLFSKIFHEPFLALYMTWGAINELTTLRGYEQLEGETPNPIFREICQRIAKQERRHFAWYFNSAYDRLERSSLNRRFTRRMLRLFWTPVGAGVKRQSEVLKLLATLFPGERGDWLAHQIDEKISSLPGLAGITLMRPYTERAQNQMRGVGERAGSLPDSSEHPALPV